MPSLDFNDLPSASLTELIGQGGLVVVAPHPDDEALGCGGLIAEACAQKRSVKIVIVSDGCGSHRGSRLLPPERLRDMRVRESVEAMGILGVAPEDVSFLDVPDSAVPSAGAEAEELSDQIVLAVRAANASTIVVTWRYDPHPDHRACYALARLVKRWHPEIRLLEYPVWGYLGSDGTSPELPKSGIRFNCGQHRELRRKAMLSYQSQLAPPNEEGLTYRPLPQELLDICTLQDELFFDLPHDEGQHQFVRHIHQIFLVDGFKLPKRVPGFVNEHAARLKALYRGAEYRLWDGDSIRELISRNFDKDVLWAFDLMRPYSYKADLAKSCVLYLFGGLYADLSMLAIRPLFPPKGIGIATFRDVDFTSSSWSAMGTGLIWAVPQRREFELAIRYIVDNCRTQYYGDSPLHPTGPVVLGRALAAAMVERGGVTSSDDQWIGMNRVLTPEAAQKNVAYIAPDRSLVALLQKYEGGDLARLGARGTNNYNAFWHQRAVYGEARQAWRFDDRAVRVSAIAKRTDAGIFVSDDAVPQGFLTFGPYITLDPGAYVLQVIFTSASILPPLIVEVSCDHGEEIVVERRWPGGGTVEGAVELKFALPKARHFVEFRTQVFGPLESGISEIRLEKVGEPAVQAAC